jgi:hypothetical protein
MFNRSYCYRVALILSVVILSACGGGGGDNSAGSDNVTSVGRIDGFGSVYVNGIEYDTTNTTYRVDDETAYDDSDLAVGMKVRIEGYVNSDNRTGVANSIYYDDDIEGPIDSGSLVDDGSTKTFTVLGLNVSVDAATTVFHDGASYAGLVEGVEIEVSGFFDGDVLIASRVELQRDSRNDYEIKGVLTQYDGTTLTLQLRNGVELGPYAVSSSVNTNDLPSDPVGSYVEIKLENNAGTLEVVRIEGEEEHLVQDHDYNVSLRGILEGNATEGYSINGTPIELTPDTRYEPSSLAGSLESGLMVKVKGEMSNGTLIAYKVEARYRESEVKARVSAVDYSDAKNGSVTLDLGNSQTIIVFTDNSTSFESGSDDDHYDTSSSDSNDDCADDSSSSGYESHDHCSDDHHYGSSSSFVLSDLTDTDFVEVEIATRDSGFYAQSIERKSGSEGTEVKALVEDVTADRISVLGVSFMIDGNTRVRGTPSIGVKVEIKDYNSDGTAERVEVEDDSHHSS